MTVTVNGEKHEIKEGMSLKDLLDFLRIESETVVVERNQEIFSHTEFAVTKIRPGDVLEIACFMGGG